MVSSPYLGLVYEIETSTLIRPSHNSNSNFLGGFGYIVLITNNPIWQSKSTLLRRLTRFLGRLDALNMTIVFRTFGTNIIGLSQPLGALISILMIDAHNPLGLGTLEVYCSRST